MSSINDAIFRGRMRRNDPPPAFDVLNRSQMPLTRQFLARKAVEAVLAGGYTKCEPEIQEAPNPAPAAPDRTKLVRDAALWTCILALAGVIGLAATSLLPSHAVQARTAARREAQADVLSAAAATGAEAEKDVAASAEATRVTALEGPQPQMVATATIKLKPAEDPQPAGAPMQRVRLAMPEAQAAPAPRSVGYPAGRPAGLLAATPDDQPAQAGATVSAATHPAVEEVLYEGEPAAAERPAGVGARQAKAEASESGGKPCVEGIFYDKVRPMAIINGNIVEVGKKVGDCTVAEIRSDMVVLARGAERIEIHP